MSFIVLLPTFQTLNMNVVTMENVGLATAAYLGVVFGFRFLQVVRNLFGSPSDVAKLGSWALVTGATDGIGKAYAFALAAKGLNVVLVSRSPDKLRNVAGKIENNHKVETKIVPVDFKTSDAEYIPKVREVIQGIDIGVLVNNVGMM